MLRDAFSFEGRIGRLDFFLAGLVLALGVVVAFLGLAAFAAATEPGLGRTIFLASLVLGLVVGALWFDLSLYVRRVRDIGWSPFYVLVGYFIFQCVDVIVALKMPELAVGSHTHHALHHTLAGVVVNLLFGRVLLFKRGRDDQPTTPRPTRLDWIGASRSVEDAPAPRVAVALPRPAQAGFGRRGLR